jgi:hypothetical protein
MFDKQAPQMSGRQAKTSAEVVLIFFVESPVENLLNRATH